MAPLAVHARRHRYESVVAMRDEWARLDVRAQDLRREPPAHVNVEWILRRQAAIREAMIETPAVTMADVAAKHHLATAQNATLDEDLLESAVSDIVRFVYA